MEGSEKRQVKPLHLQTLFKVRKWKCFITRWGKRQLIKVTQLTYLYLSKHLGSALCQSAESKRFFWPHKLARNGLCTDLFSSADTWHHSHRTECTYHEGDCYGVLQSPEEKASFKQLLCHRGVTLTLAYLPDIAGDGDHWTLLSSLFSSSGHSRAKV